MENFSQLDDTVVSTDDGYLVIEQDHHMGNEAVVRVPLFMVDIFIAALKKEVEAAAR